jgi:hypothetical protein
MAEREREERERERERERLLKTQASISRFRVAIC